MSVLAPVVLDSLRRAQRQEEPWRHWRLDPVLTDTACREVAGLPFAPAHPDAGAGKRDASNDTRLFVSPAMQRRFPVCEEIARAFQAPATVAEIERLCEVSLAGSFLRIEYCQDVDGFWLEPHTDIGAKLFTLLIYLSEDGKSTWGTDLMTPQGKVVDSVSYRRNTGLIFVPARDTWHGFQQRPIAGIRRSMIVNYVKSEWRARQELAFPHDPIGVF